MGKDSVLHSLSSPSRKTNTNREALGEEVAWITIIRYKQPHRKGCTVLLTWCLMCIFLVCFY